MSIIWRGYDGGEWACNSGKRGRSIWARLTSGAIAQRLEQATHNRKRRFFTERKLLRKTHKSAMNIALDAPLSQFPFDSFSLNYAQFFGLSIKSSIKSKSGESALLVRR